MSWLLWFSRRLPSLARTKKEGMMYKNSPTAEFRNVCRTAFSFPPMIGLAA